MSDQGVTGISPRSLERHRDQCRQLYEQARHKGLTHQQASTRVAAYRTRWKNWAAGLCLMAD